MKGIIKLISLILCVSIIVSLAGCGGETEVVSSEQPNYRDPAQTEQEPEAFVDTDGDFDYETVNWNGPEDYVIIYPSGDKKAKESATTLRNYFKSAYGVTLALKTDATEETEKEILVGGTNRKASKKGMDESELSVAVSGGKLTFNAGHAVTLASAVNKFVRLAPEKGKAYTFSLKTDFVSTVLDGYEYVWGDEFEGSDVDFTKWDFEERMSGSTKLEISWEKDVIDVADGRLKLHGINYYNPLREGTRYKSPYSVVTKYKMNYVYGYAEIRARVPYEKGAWPSFWGLQIGANGGTNKNGGVAYDEEKSKNAKYGVEVDIFEVFGSLTTLEPTIHRHYNTGVYNYSEIHGTDKNSYSDGSNVRWNWEERGGNIETLSQEYHTYGFLWTKTEYSFYVDGIKYETVDITKSFDKCPDYQGFHEPLFLMFNNHVFADDMSYYANEVEDHSTLPFCYYIDWIRVYQKKGVGSKLYIDTTPKTYLGR